MQHFHTPIVTIGWRNITPSIRSLRKRQRAWPSWSNVEGTSLVQEILSIIGFKVSSFALICNDKAMEPSYYSDSNNMHEIKESAWCTYRHYRQLNPFLNDWAIRHLVNTTSKPRIFDNSHIPSWKSDSRRLANRTSFRNTGARVTGKNPLGSQLRFSLLQILPECFANNFRNRHVVATWLFNELLQFLVQPFGNCQTFDSSATHDTVRMSSSDITVLHFLKCVTRAGLDFRCIRCIILLACWRITLNNRL